MAAGVLPGDLVARRRLLPPDQRPIAKLSRRDIGATEFQRRTGTTAVVEIVFIADRSQTGRTVRFNHRRCTDHRIHRLRRHTDVTSNVGGGRGHAMGAARERIGGVAPATVGIRSHCTEQGRAVEQLDRAACLGGAAQLDLVAVNDRISRDDRSIGCNGVDGHLQRRDRTDIAGGIG